MHFRPKFKELLQNINNSPRDFFGCRTGMAVARQSQFYDRSPHTLTLQSVCVRADAHTPAGGVKNEVFRITHAGRSPRVTMATTVLEGSGANSVPVEDD